MKSDTLVLQVGGFDNGPVTYQIKKKKRSATETSKKGVHMSDLDGAARGTVVVIPPMTNRGESCEEISVLKN